MNLVNSDLNILLKLHENVVNVVVLERKEDFVSCVKHLQQLSKGLENSFFLYEDEKKLQLDKMSQVIINPFDINFSDRKLLTSLYSKLSRDANLFLEYQDEFSRVSLNIIEKLLSMQSYPAIGYNVNFSWNDFFQIILYSIRL